MHTIHTLRAFALATLTLAFVHFAPGCDFARKAWPTVRTIMDIALLQCQATAAANEHELAGKTPAEWCALPGKLEPFLAAQRQAAYAVSDQLQLAAPPLTGPED